MQDEDILYTQDGYAIAGFINSNSDLEHNIYKQVDGGCIDLVDRVYSKDELLELLEIELESFIIILGEKYGKRSLLRHHSKAGYDGDEKCSYYGTKRGEKSF